MNRIHILDPEISKRLAAGEVVQNPASVVKELIENSIDAGATAITIEIQKGGITKIRVTDNGSGIHPDDMIFALVKHATSKINNFNDIYTINTLGFRGEALASISAVSNIEIKSQAYNEEVGRIIKNYGIKSGIAEPAGLPFGTTVIVSELFYNIPARKKFLKTPVHEGFAVTDLISKLILSRPDISFKFINGDKTVFHSPGNSKILNAVSSVYGSDIVQHLCEVDYQDSDIHIHGFVSDLNLVFRTSKNITFFVNGRYVISKLMSDAVKNGYNDQLMKGRFPFSVLFIEVAANSVDVNVHPGKAFVTMDNTEEILMAITRSVKNAVDFNQIPKIRSLNNSFNISNDELYKDETKNQYGYSKDTQETLGERMSFTDIINAVEKEESYASVEKQFFNKIINYKIIGSIFATYLIIESNNKVFFIDQHAAHERINYESLLSNQNISSRQLLIPAILTLSEEDMTVMDSNHQILDEIGFNFENFGGNSIKISSVPTIIANESIRVFVEDTVLELKKNSDSIVLKKDKIIRNACRLSVKAGDALSSAEIELLVNEILTNNIIPLCPHGRPIAIVMTKEDFEKSFKRKV